MCCHPTVAKAKPRLNAGVVPVNPTAWARTKPTSAAGGAKTFLRRGEAVAKVAKPRTTAVGAVDTALDYLPFGPTIKKGAKAVAGAQKALVGAVEQTIAFAKKFDPEVGV